MRRLLPVWEVRGRRELGEPEQLRLDFVEDRVRQLLEAGAVSVAVQEWDRRLECWAGEFRNRV